LRPSDHFRTKARRGGIPPRSQASKTTMEPEWEGREKEKERGPGEREREREKGEGRSWRISIPYPSSVNVIRRRSRRRKLYPSGSSWLAVERGSFSFLSKMEGATENRLFCSIEPKASLEPTPIAADDAAGDFIQ
jgi:hypothetical protein